MQFDKHLRMVLEHKDEILYNERFQMVPVMNVLSFLTPSHAILYNTFVNYQHWYNADNDGQMTIMRIATPKANFNSRLIWNNYQKKPKKETINNKKAEDWIITVFEVSRKVAQLYLEDETVLEEVKERIKGN